MAGRRLLNPALFVCDIQEKFRPAIWEYPKVISTAQKAIRASATLSIPIFATTQSASRLGPLCAELNLPASTPLYDKTAFSMLIPEIRFALNAASAIASQPPSLQQQQQLPLQPQLPFQVAIVGIEAHICVTQTALDLLAEGHKVYVLADGVSSCHEGEVGVALRRLAREGVVITTSEGWLYECMGDAAIEEFKAITGLVKETRQSTKEAVQTLCKA